MSMHDAVERYKKAQESHEWRYMSLEKADALELAEYITAGFASGGAEARLYIHRALKENGRETLWFAVGDATTTGPAFNNSHPCPPCCPSC